MDVLRSVARYLADRDPGHPLRVGIDGICGAGKSTFAVSLTAAVAATGRPALRVDSDGFHHVRERRRRNVADPARGYYDDAYDFDSLAEAVLRPLGPGGDRTYATRVHDLATDAVITGEYATAAPNAVVVFDATFLQGDVLAELWDEVVFLDADEAAATARGIARDSDALGGAAAARVAYDERYLAACRIYLRERDPRSRASVVVDNTDPRHPVIVRM